MTSDPKYLSVREAAAVLGVTYERVRQLCANGKLPFIAKPYGWKVMRFIPRKAVEARRRALKSTLPPDRVSP